MLFRELYFLACAPRLFLGSSPQLICVYSVFARQVAILFLLHIFISLRAHVGVFLDSSGVVTLTEVDDCIFLR